MKNGYLVRYYENQYVSYGGHWVEKYHGKIDQAIEDYIANLNKEPHIYICTEFEIKVDFKSKIKSYLRQFKVPSVIKIKNVEFD